MGLIPIRLTFTDLHWEENGWLPSISTKMKFACFPFSSPLSF